MKIFNTMTTTLFTITLLMVSPSFGMGKKPNKDDKPKKSFGPDTTTNVPADVEKYRQEKRRQYQEQYNEDPATLDQQLRSAIATLGDKATDDNTMNTINTLLSSGANPNYIKTSASMLHITVDNKKFCPIVQSLLQWKADPNIKKLFSLTPLHTATRAQNAKAIDLLLTAGADANIQNVLKETPMFYLAKTDLRSSLVYFRHGIFAKKDSSFLDDEVALNQLKKALVSDKETQAEYAEHRKKLALEVKSLNFMPSDLTAIIIDYLPTKYTWFSDLPSTSSLLHPDNKTTERQQNPLLTPSLHATSESPSSLPAGTPLSVTSAEGENTPVTTHPAGYLRDQDNPASLQYRAPVQQAGSESSSSSSLSLNPAASTPSLDVSESEDDDSTTYYV